MTNRMIDLSDEPAHLSVRNSLLIIERKDKDEVTLPLADLAVLVVSHPRVSFTHAVLSGIAVAGGSLITCDEKHMPVAMIMPLTGHHLQAERFSRQANVTLPIRKKLWQQIVREKIKAQAKLLDELRGNDNGLSALVSRVKSGDPANVEAQASRRYWQALFPDSGFRRDRDREDQNRHLNYGYAVLRAIVARAVCSSGLHPSLGLHHHNRYDAFCLADDIMEPFRPVIDSVVARMVDLYGNLYPLDKTSKAAILESLTGRFIINGESRTLFDIVSRTTSSLANIFAGENDKLIFPDAQ
ncbi:MAG: type II CRISPR-associated endonuclease Cas1 [Planctomycetota bacterium]